MLDCLRNSKDQIGAYETVSFCLWSFLDQIKPFVIGRKNWLFTTSPKGAQASAIIYSVMNTAQANGLDVKEYLNAVFHGTDKPLLG